jgi:hypothetical protein
MNGDVFWPMPIGRWEDGHAAIEGLISRRDAVETTKKNLGKSRPALALSGRHQKFVCDEIVVSARMPEPNCLQAGRGWVESGMPLWWYTDGTP